MKSSAAARYTLSFCRARALRPHAGMSGQLTKAHSDSAGAKSIWKNTRPQLRDQLTPEQIEALVTKAVERANEWARAGFSYSSVGPALRWRNQARTKQLTSKLMTTGFQLERACRGRTLR